MAKSVKQLPHSYAWVVSAAFVLAGLGVTGVLVANKTDERRRLFMELTANQSEQDRHLQEYTRLLIERGTLSAYHNVDRIAIDALNMRFPEEVERITRRDVE